MSLERSPAEVYNRLGYQSATFGVPTKQMIIVFADDQTVAIYPDMNSIHCECENVDVENEVYRFFDHLGRRLVPKFATPVKRNTSLFGLIKTVDGGSFELRLDIQDHGQAFQHALANAIAIEPNPNCASITELQEWVAENQKCDAEIR